LLTACSFTEIANRKLLLDGERSKRMQWKFYEDQRALQISLIRSPQILVLMTSFWRRDGFQIQLGKDVQFCKLK